MRSILWPPEQSQVAKLIQRKIQAPNEMRTNRPRKTKKLRRKRKPRRKSRRRKLRKTKRRRKIELRISPNPHQTLLTLKKT